MKSNNGNSMGLYPFRFASDYRDNLELEVRDVIKYIHVSKSKLEFKREFYKKSA